MAEPMAILKQLLIADRKQRAPQRRKHRQLIVRPLDGRERGAQRLDFRAIVKRPAAYQQMGNAARLERLDVQAASCPVPEADESAEQQADVTRLDRDEALCLAGLKAEGAVGAMS